MTNTKLLEQRQRIFEELITLSETVFKICLGFAKNPWDAEDLTQEVYLKAYRRLDSLKDFQHAREWIFRIARNTGLDYSRRHRVRRIFHIQSKKEPAEKGTPESRLAYVESLKAIKRVVQQLPKKHREVFVLREYGDLSYRDIALVLGVKEGTVMSRLKRARETVRTQIEEENHERG